MVLTKINNSSMVFKYFIFLTLFALFFPLFQSQLGSAGAILVNGGLIILISTYFIIKKKLVFSLSVLEKKYFLLYVSIWIFFIFHIALSISVGFIFGNVTIIERDLFEFHRPILYLLIFIFTFLGFLLYLFKYFNSKKMMITIFLFSILIAFIGGAGKLVILLTELLDLGSDTRLLLYLSGADSQAFALFGGTFLVHLVLSFFLLMKYNPLTNYSEYNKILVPMYIYGTVLIFMFIDIGIISSRIRDLFTVPSSIILIPMLLKIIDGRYKNLVFFAIIVYSMIFFTLMIKNNIEMPYKNLIMM